MAINGVKHGQIVCGGAAVRTSCILNCFFSSTSTSINNPVDAVDEFVLCAADGVALHFQEALQVRRSFRDQRATFGVLRDRLLYAIVFYAVACIDPAKRRRL